MFELSHQQYNIWLSIQINPESSFRWNIVNEKLVNGKLNIIALKTAWHSILEGNSILRYKIITIAGKPFQEINPYCENHKNFVYEDFSYDDIISAEHKAEERYLSEVNTNSDLQANNIKLVVLQLPNNKYHLILRCHHIFADGVSVAKIWEGLINLYNHTTTGKEFKQSIWQYSEFLNRSLLEKHEGLERKKPRTYWEQKYKKEIPWTGIPLKSEWCNNSDLAASEFLFANAMGLKSFCSKHRTTAATLVLAVYYLILSRYSNQSDIVIGTYYAGRDQDERFDSMIGMFVNTIGLRFDIQDECTFRQLLKESFKIYKEGYDNQHISFADLNNLANKANTQALFSVAYNYFSEDALPMFLDIESQAPVRRNARFIDNDLTLRVYDYNDKLEIRLDYKAHKYSSSLVKRMLDSMAHILDSLSDILEINIFQLPIIAPDERTLLTKFSCTNNKSIGSETIIDLFQLQVKLNPEKTAAVFNTITVTYGQLEHMASALAELLSLKGVKRGCLVPVLFEQTPELLISFLAILKVGGVYVPLDNSWPEIRLTEILTEIEPVIVLSHSDLKMRNFKVLSVDRDVLNQMAYEKKQNLNIDLLEPCYMIYTSGSTGKPKGVLIPYKGLMNRLFWMNDFFGPEVSESVIVTTKYIYDSSIWQMLWPLINGGKTIMMAPDDILSVSKLTAAIFKHKVSMIDFVPSMFLFISNSTEKSSELYERLSPLKAIIIGGDEINRNAAVNFKKRHPLIRLFNLYGPTEATIGCVAHEISNQESIEVPIGKPIQNVYAFVLNNQQVIQPIGVIGDLYVGGYCVGLGYYKDAQKTAKSFITIPTIHNSVLYKTGDLVKWNEQGNLIFHGRNDFQVKIRGFRIELAEVSSAIEKYQNISKAIVTVGGEGENKMLCSYIKADVVVNLKKLKEFLKRNLPGHLIPNTIIQIDKIPLTESGKIDFKSLPKAERESVADNENLSLTDLQKQLIQIWSAILCIDSRVVDCDQNFFELGGNSINALEMLFKVYTFYDVEVAISEFFRNPTISGLCNSISKAGKQELVRMDRQVKYNLSASQTRIFVLHNMDPSSLIYNVPSIFKLKGDVNFEKLEKSFLEVILRHEILRSRFEIEDVALTQYISPVEIFKIPRFESTEQRVLNDLKNFVQPFDLEVAPLCRAATFKVDNYYILSIDFHHILVDGISIGIFIRELCQIYNSEPLPDVLFNYQDFIHMEQSVPVNLKQKSLDFWLKQLHGVLPKINLSTDYQRPLYQSYEGNSVSFKIEVPEKNDLLTAAKRMKISAFTLFFSAFVTTLFRITGDEDIIIGVPVSGRPLQQFQKTIGPFANTVPVRCFPNRNMPFRQLVEDVKKKLIDVFSFESFSLDEIIKHLRMDRDWSRNPVYDVLFSYQTEYIQDINFNSIEWTRFDKHEEIYNVAKLDLAFWCIQSSDGILVKVEYCSALFKRETILRFTEAFEEMLKEISQDDNFLL